MDRIGHSHGGSNACLALLGLGVILAVVLLPRHRLTGRRNAVAVPVLAPQP
jgi:hypothetical protein